jgi:hypothetical protein
MSDIACPSCMRKLALPEENWIGLAQCPSCGAVFRPIESRFRADRHSAHIPSKQLVDESQIQTLEAGEHHPSDGPQLDQYRIPGFSQNEATRLWRLLADPEFPYDAQLLKDGIILGPFLSSPLLFYEGLTAYNFVSWIWVGLAFGFFTAFAILLFTRNLPDPAKLRVLMRLSSMKRIAAAAFVAALCLALIPDDERSFRRGNFLILLVLILAFAYQMLRVFPTMLSFVEPSDLASPSQHGHHEETGALSRGDSESSFRTNARVPLSREPEATGTAIRENRASPIPDETQDKRENLTQT